MGYENCCGNFCNFVFGECKVFDGVFIEDYGIFFFDVYEVFSELDFLVMFEVWWFFIFKVGFFYRCEGKYGNISVDFFVCIDRKSVV